MAVEIIFNMDTAVCPDQREQAARGIYNKVSSDCSRLFSRCPYAASAVLDENHKILSQQSVNH